MRERENKQQSHYEERNRGGGNKYSADHRDGEPLYNSSKHVQPGGRRLYNWILKKIKNIKIIESVKWSFNDNSVFLIYFVFHF